MRDSEFALACFFPRRCISSSHILIKFLTTWPLDLQVQENFATIAVHTVHESLAIQVGSEVLNSPHKCQHLMSDGTVVSFCFI